MEISSPQKKYEVVGGILCHFFNMVHLHDSRVRVYTVYTVCIYNICVFLPLR